MSVRLQRLEGVESVEVSLNEGRADIGLAAGNSVALQRVRDFVEQAGFSPREARVTVRGEVRTADEGPQLLVTGTGETYALVAEETELRERIARRAGGAVTVEGVVPVPEKGADRRATPVLRVVNIRPNDAPA